MKSFCQRNVCIQIQAQQKSTNERCEKMIWLQSLFFALQHYWTQTWNKIPNNKKSQKERKKLFHLDRSEMAVFISYQWHIQKLPSKIFWSHYFKTQNSRKIIFLCFYFYFLSLRRAISCKANKCFKEKGA